MKILYILQQSVYNNDPRWSTADSNINMFCGFAREITKNTDWKIDVLIAPLKDFFDIQDYGQIIFHKNINFIPFEFPVDAFLNRQNFPVQEWVKILSAKYDVVINNITELSRNIRSILEIKKIKSKLITQCFWLDCPEIGQEKVAKTMSYDWRQFDSFECSDLVTFTCQSTKEAFIANSKKKFASKYIKKILKKSSIWDFGYSANELDEEKPKIINPERKLRILFLNRLSGINYTHHVEFIVAIKELLLKRKDFEVCFTNPSRKIGAEDLNLDPEFFKFPDHPLDRQEYIRLLWSGHVSINLYRNELYGGVAFRETTHCDNITVTPKVFEYKKINGNFYPFYTDNKFENLKFKIDDALDKYSKFIESDKFKEIKIRNKQMSSFESISNKVIEDIRKL